MNGKAMKVKEVERLEDVREIKNARWERKGKSELVERMECVEQCIIC